MSLILHGRTSAYRNLNRTAVGIDVSKRKLGIALSGKPSVTTSRYDKVGLLNLLRALKKIDPQIVCSVAAGGLERRLVDVLREDGHNISVVNPGQACDFARPAGQFARPHAGDLRILAMITDRMPPRCTSPATVSQRKMRDFMVQRCHVSRLSVYEKNAWPNSLTKTTAGGVRVEVGIDGADLRLMSSSLLPIGSRSCGRAPAVGFDHGK